MQQLHKLGRMAAICGIAAGALLSFDASASTALTLTGATYGFENGSISYSGSPSVYYGNVNAGGFAMSGFSQSLTAWCIDIFHTVNIGSTHRYNFTAANSSNTNNHFNTLQKFVDTYYGSVNNAVTSAAFQLGVWEIVNENARNSLSLTTGLFKASGFSTSDNLANSWLSALGSASPTNHYNITLLTPTDRSQGLMTVTPVSSVPLPGAALLMFSAIGLGGVMRRRQGAAAMPV